MELIKVFIFILQFWCACSRVVPYRKISIDYEVDRFLEKLNRKNDADGTTLKDLGSGRVGDYTYRGATVLGVDSLKRTGDCFKEILGTEVKYTFRAGLGLLQAFFRRVAVNGASFSASSRLFDNSLRLSYTIEKESQRDCSVSVNGLAVEQAGGAVLYASSPMYDQMDMSHFLRNDLVPRLNEMLREQENLVREFLERMHCRRNPKLYAQNSELTSLFNAIISK